MEEMTFGKAIKTCFKKYCVFKGRARRSEYWYWILFTFLVSLGISALQGLLAIPVLIKDGSPEMMVTISSAISIAFGVAVFLPTLGVNVRRLHDTGRSGWWVLLLYLIEVAAIVFIFAGVGFDYFITNTLPEEMNLTLISIGGIIMLFAIVLAIVMLVWLIKDSTPGPNKYGPNPKESPVVEPLVEKQPTEVKE